MATTAKNLERFRGDTYPWRVVVGAEGRPLDITGDVYTLIVGELTIHADITL